MPIALSSPPIVVGIRQTISDSKHRQGREDHAALVRRLLVVDGHRRQDEHHDDEERGQADQNDVQRDLVRRQLAARALDHPDHPVEEGIALLGGDADDDPVARDARAAGNGAAVAAALPYDGRGLAGDRRLVNRRDALDDLAVRPDQVSRGAHDAVPNLQLAARDGHLAAVDQLLDGRLRPHLAQLVGVRLAPALSHRLGEVREEAGEPEPEADLQVEARRIPST